MFKKISEFKFHPNFYNISIVIALIIGSTTGKVFVEDYFKHKRQVKLETIAKEISEDVNKLLPKKIDESTILTSVSHNGASITYNYFITEYSTYGMPSELFLKSVKENFVKKGCDDKNFKGLIQNGLAIHGSYTSDKNEPIGTISLTKSDCVLKS